MSVSDLFDPVCDRFNRWMQYWIARRYQSATGDMAKSVKIKYRKTGLASHELEVYTDSPYLHKRDDGIADRVTEDRILEWLQQKNEFQDAGWTDEQMSKLAPSIADTINKNNRIRSGQYGWNMRRNVVVKHKTGIWKKAHEGFRDSADIMEGRLEQHVINEVRVRLLQKSPYKIVDHRKLAFEE
jgi:hypothetical protein